MNHDSPLTSRLILLITMITLSGCSTLGIQYDGPNATPSMTEARYNASLPPDVNHQSRGRLPLVNRAELDDKGKVSYDRYMSPESTSLAGIQGPGGIRLHINADKVPKKMNNKIRELIRLVTAREMDQQFEWTMHEPVAVKEGLDPEIIDIVRYKRSLRGVSEPEASVIQMGREVFQEHKITSETYSRLTKYFSTTDLIQMTELIGNGMNSFSLLYMFDVHLPYDRPPLLPVR